MVSSPKSKTEMAKLFRTKSHRHSLELKNSLKPYICDGCKENGFGPRYRCEKCDFDLHKHCMFPETSPISHEFFPNSTFKFLTTPPKACHKYCKRQCDACRKPINGFVYYCKKHDLDLHPCCRNLKRKYKIKAEEQHEEEEVVELNLHKKVQQKCFWCKKKSIKEGDHSTGWSYISNCKKYHIHVACISEMIKEEWSKKSDHISKINYNVTNGSQQTVVLQKVNLKEIEAQRKGNNGKSGNKYWRIIKVFVKTIVSIVLGDPTMIFASLLVELL